MELRQLEYFVAVAEEASVSAAARRLGVAQPSVSQAIARLERELGRPLLDRLPRRVVPTPAGERLLASARRVLAAAAEASLCASDEGDGPLAGPLAVGAIPTVAPFLLPALVRAFERKHPGVELSITEDATARLVEGLRRGELDLAVASTVAESPQLHARRVADEPLLLMAPAGHRLARARRVPADALAGERFLALHEAHCLADQAARFCLRRGGRSPAVMRGSNLATIAAMVAAGLGVSVAPRMMAGRAARPAGCAFRPFADPAPSRPLTLVLPLLRYRTRAARAFAAMAEAALRKAGRA